MRQLLARVFGYAAALVLMFMVLFTAWAVFQREVFDVPVLGVVDVMELALVTCVFFAIPAVFLRDEHIVVDVIDQIVSPAACRRLKITGLLVAAGLLITMMVEMLPAARETYSSGEVTMTLSISRFIHWIPIVNATTASMKSTEVYAALEKGVVDASAWTSIGIMDLKWDKFVKYRVDPAFYQTDIGVIMNLDKWNSLSDDSKKILSEAMIDWEKKSYEDRQADIKTDAEKLKAGGMTFVSMSDAAAKVYLQQSVDASWARMKGRLDKMGGMENYDKLRKHYMGE